MYIYIYVYLYVYIHIYMYQLFFLAQVETIYKAENGELTGKNSRKSIRYAISALNDFQVVVLELPLKNRWKTTRLVRRFSDKFSKVFSLLNLLREITLELTFEKFHQTISIKRRTSSAMLRSL